MKTRIKEKINAMSGTSRFIPQIRKFFIWCNLDEYREGKIGICFDCYVFKTKEEARDIIKRYKLKKTRKPTIKYHYEI